MLLNPLNAALGFYGGEADFGVGRHLAIAVEGDIYNMNGTVSTAFGGGLLWYPLGISARRFRTQLFVRTPDG
jgi:hypothetical protein